MPNRDDPFQPAAPTAAQRPRPDAVEPLTEQQVAYLQRVAYARRPVRNAARTASTSAITILAIALLALLFSVAILDLTGVVTSVAIGGIGIFEWLGYQQLKRDEPAGASYLGRNQLFFVAVIIAYCVWQCIELATGAVSDSLTQGDMGYALAQAGYRVDDFVPYMMLIGYAFYGLIAFLSIIFQGGLAFYYFTRRKPIERYLSRYPAWARDVVDKC
jgi:hypothetical protein